MADTPDPQINDAADSEAAKTYHPDTVGVNLGREQGLGMGQRDLDAQRDAEVETDPDADPAPRVRQPDDPFPRLERDAKP